MFRTFTCPSSGVLIYKVVSLPHVVLCPRYCGCGPTELVCSHVHCLSVSWKLLSYTIHLRYQYMCFLFNRTTLQVFVTCLTGALYVHLLWFYKHQHENRVRSRLFVACQHVAFSLPFPAILVNCAPSGEMHNYFTPHIIKENFENFLIHRCNYIQWYLG